MSIQRTSFQPLRTTATKRYKRQQVPHLLPKNSKNRGTNAWSIPVFLNSKRQLNIHTAHLSPASQKEFINLDSVSYLHKFSSPKHERETVLRRMHPMSPSKYDHFHEGTFFQTHIPTVELKTVGTMDLVKLPQAQKPSSPPKPFSSYRHTRNPRSPRQQSPRQQTSSSPKRRRFRMPSNYVPRSQRVIQLQEAKQTPLNVTRPKTTAKVEHNVLILPDGSDFSNPKYAQVDLQPYKWGLQAANALKFRRKDEFLERVSFYLGSAKKPYKHMFLVNGNRVSEIDEIPPEAEVIILGHSMMFQGIDMTQKSLAKNFGERWSKENAEDVDSPNRTRTVTPPKKRGVRLHIKKGSAQWNREENEKEPGVEELLKGNGISFATEDQVWYA